MQLGTDVRAPSLYVEYYVYGIYMCIFMEFVWNERDFFLLIFPFLPHFPIVGRCGVCASIDAPSLHQTPSNQEIEKSKKKNAENFYGLLPMLVCVFSVLCSHSHSTSLSLYFFHAFSTFA